MLYRKILDETRISLYCRLCYYMTEVRRIIVNNKRKAMNKVGKLTQGRLRYLEATTKDNIVSYFIVDILC